MATEADAASTLVRESASPGGTPLREIPSSERPLRDRSATRPSLRLALVVQRYGQDVDGGAEYHCRLIAEHLSGSHRVEVITSCARNYITWANERPAGLERVNGVAVRRFKVKRPRDPDRFGRISQKVFLGRHDREDELSWLEEQGPFSPALVKHLRKHERDYDYFIFFSYRYYHSFQGVHAVPAKAILVPTCEKDAVVSLGIFRDLFRLPRAIVYNSVEERSMIWAAAGNQAVKGEVVGVGSEVPETADPESFRARHRVHGPYMVYVGRIDPNKGCRTLFNFFRRYREETDSTLDLLLVGGKQMEIPEQPGLRYLGFLPDTEKWGAIAGAELLVIPSELESLSMVTLEAWSQGRPVLANGKCDVLKGQCRRSRAGLYYDDYYEFREALGLLESSRELRDGLGANGRRYFQQHYSWEVIVGKYDRILDALVREDRVRVPEPKRGFLSRVLAGR